MRQAENLHLKMAVLLCMPSGMKVRSRKECSSRSDDAGALLADPQRESIRRCQDRQAKQPKKGNASEPFRLGGVGACEPNGRTESLAVNKTDIGVKEYAPPGRSVAQRTGDFPTIYKRGL